MKKYFLSFLFTVYCVLPFAVQAQQWHKLGNGIGYSSICVKCFKKINGDL